MKTEITAAFHIMDEVTAFKTEDTRIHSLPWVWIRVFRRALFSAVQVTAAAGPGEAGSCSSKWLRHSRRC